MRPKMLFLLLNFWSMRSAIRNSRLKLPSVDLKESTQLPEMGTLACAQVSNGVALTAPGAALYKLNIWLYKGTWLGAMLATVAVSKFRSGMRACMLVGSTIRNPSKSQKKK